MTTAEEIRDYERCLRCYARIILIARIKLLLLWLPATLGLSWATESVLNQRERIAHAKYGAEDTAQDLWKLRTYGTTWAMIVFPREEDSKGYDGWLAPEDRYQGDRDA
jgi:hypothetical protein